MSEVDINTAIPDVSVSMYHKYILKDKQANLLVQASKWSQNADEALEQSNFTDLYFLVHRGVPDELRTQVWKQLLQTKKIMEEDYDHLYIAYQKYYKAASNENPFEIYMQIAKKWDCTAFRQIDEDVGRFQFQDKYL
jgi:hypothetical protein